MCVFFGAQDVLDLFNDGYVVVAANAIEAQRNMYRELRKKDQKALFYIHQCVDVNGFKSIIYSMTENALWDILVCFYGGDALVEKVKP